MMCITLNPGLIDSVNAVVKFESPCPKSVTLRVHVWYTLCGYTFTRVYLRACVVRPGRSLWTQHLPSCKFSRLWRLGWAGHQPVDARANHCRRLLPFGVPRPFSRPLGPLVARRRLVHGSSTLLAAARVELPPVDRHRPSWLALWRAWRSGRRR